MDLPDIDIDTQSSQRKAILEAVKEIYEADGVKRVINCCTHTTEKARSSILTACRGLEIDPDISQNIANMIPSSALTLTQCFYGDAEEGIKPVPGLIDELKKHEGLFEIVEMFEGLISGRSVHTSGVFILNNGIIEQNAIMTSTSGTLVTQFNYTDSVYCGCLKLDFLSTAALEKIRSCMDLLLEHGKMEWQGSLRETYNKYIHPDVLDFDSPEMYDLLYHGDILDAFQFETVQGRKAIRVVQPRKFNELMDSNSLMRLSCDGEQPIERYVKFKKDINLWYTEMKQYGLNAEEIKVMEKQLLKSYGVAITQEDVMLLSMDEKISNFDIIMANKLRKAIAKADGGKLAKEVQVIYYEKGLANGTRAILLDYVWEKCIKPQLGYSFSKNHTCPYTCILLQEMNLAYKFGTIWWKTAVLSNNSGIINGESKSGVGYGVIAKALSKMPELILAPDINKSNIGFTPDEERNKILFGLISIDGLGKNEVATIIENRPYASIQEVWDKTNLSLKKKITIVKSGALDCFNNNRRQIMIELIRNNTPLAEKLTMSQFDKVKEFLPDEMKFFEDVVYFSKNIIKKYSYDIEESKDKLVKLPLNYEDKLELLHFTDYDYENANVVFSLKAFQKIYNAFIAPLKDWLKKPEVVDKFNRKKLNEAWAENCLGTKESWEMETTVFYHDKHELDYYDLSLFKISNFETLPEEIQKVEVPTANGRTRKATVTTTIAGTVIDKMKDKSRIILLTQFGPVTVKVTKQEFLDYDKKVVEVINKKEKNILEESWFTRGTKLIINGYRMKDDFKAYAYRSKAIAKITGIDKETRAPFFTVEKLI